MPGYAVGIRYYGVSLWIDICLPKPAASLEIANCFGEDALLDIKLHPIILASINEGVAYGCR